MSSNESLPEITAEEFDRLADEGGDAIDKYLDWEHARPLRETDQPGAKALRRKFKLENKVRRVNVDLPFWMIAALDEEAERLAISRQSVIKTMLASALEERGAKGAQG